MGLYRIQNGAMPTTAKSVAVTTGTSIKTMLQIKPFNVVKIVEWGISFDGSSAGTPIVCELLDTSTVNATVTASVDADIFKFGGTNAAAASVAGLTLATSGTGYTSSNEGSITASRVYDLQFVPPSGGYVKQFPLGREPVIEIANIARIRVHAPTAVNCYCYLVLEI